jgi:DNA polymerase-3 subunit delta
MAEKVTFASCEAEFNRLMSDIKARKFAPIYLLQGEELYFIDALSDALTEGIMAEEMRSFNQIVVYGNDTDGGTVASYCRQLPMMGEYEAIIVREAQLLDKIELLHAYTSSPQPSTILVICHKEKNADKRSSFYKGCAANGVVFESVTPRDYEIGGWLEQFIAGRGLKIDRKALVMLTDHLGTSISKIAIELEKLAVSMPEGATRITDADIETNIGISKDFNNFELCKAVVTRDMGRSLMIADHFARNPKDNPLLVTVMALFGQFRDLFTVNYLGWLARRKGQPMPSDQELMRILRKPSVYVVQEIKQQTALWPNKKVFEILGLLREYDAKSKGLNSGGASDGELLRELLLKIFLL